LPAGMSREKTDIVDGKWLIYERGSQF